MQESSSDCFAPSSTRETETTFPTAPEQEAGETVPTKEKASSSVPSRSDEIAVVSMNEPVKPNESEVQSLSTQRQESVVEDSKPMLDQETIALNETPSPEPIREEASLASAEEFCKKPRGSRLADEGETNEISTPVSQEEPKADPIGISNDEGTSAARSDQSFVNEGGRRSCSGNYRFGQKLQRTHREELDANDELWSPWRKRFVRRRPKATR